MCQRRSRQKHFLSRRFVVRILFQVQAAIQPVLIQLQFSMRCFCAFSLLRP
nr:MAG TPA: hypothetical protein [Caudoviricetes sp.]